MDDVELELGQSANFTLSGSDPDEDATNFVLSQAPKGGEIYSYLPGTGVIGKQFSVVVVVLEGLRFPDQRYAYLADYTSGLKILDIADVKNPFLAAQYLVDGGIQYNISISNDGNTVYLASIEYGVTVIDVSDPLAPYQRGILTSKAQRIL